MDDQMNLSFLNVLTTSKMQAKQHFPFRCELRSHNMIFISRTTMRIRRGEKHKSTFQSALTWDLSGKENSGRQEKRAPSGKFIYLKHDNSLGINK